MVNNQQQAPNALPPPPIAQTPPVQPPQPPVYTPPPVSSAPPPPLPWHIIGLVGACLLVLVLVVVSVRAKRKRVAEAKAEILDNLESGRGGVGNTSIAQAVNGAKADQNYPFALEDARKICAAGGWLGSWSQSLYTFIGGTNTASIKAVLTGKTKAQVAAIQEAFGKTACNQTLDDFLLTYCSEAERRQIYQILKSAT